MIGRRYGHLTSNIAESINAFLLRAREMPVFPMMEYIRGELMRWFDERSTKGLAEGGPVIRSVVKQIQVLMKNRARRYTGRKSTDNIWEVLSQTNVEDEDNRRCYIINLETHTCNCHRWQATGIPCAHALAIMLHLRKDPFSYVESCFHSVAYRQTYANPIFPIPDRVEWMPLLTSTDDHDSADDNPNDGDDSDIPSTLPPSTRRPAGRPKKKRSRNSPERDEENPKKLYHCSRCGGLGHNRKACRDPI